MTNITLKALPKLIAYKPNMNKIKYLIFVIFYLLVFDFTLAQTSYPKYYIGKVEVEISRRPKKSILTDCFVLVDEPSTLDIEANSKNNVPPDSLQFSSYLTLPHLSNDPKESDEDGLVWISVGPKIGDYFSYLEKKNDPNSKRLFSYAFNDPTPRAFIARTNAITDIDPTNNRPESPIFSFSEFSILVWHEAGRHHDPVKCLDLQEQKTNEEIAEFLNTFKNFKPEI